MYASCHVPLMRSLSCFLWRPSHMWSLGQTELFFCFDYRAAWQTAPRLFDKTRQLSSGPLIFISGCCCVWTYACGQAKRFLAKICESAEIDGSAKTTIITLKLLRDHAEAGKMKNVGEIRNHIKQMNDLIPIITWSEKRLVNIWPLTGYQAL